MRSAIVLLLGILFIPLLGLFDRKTEDVPEAHRSRPSESGTPEQEELAAGQTSALPKCSAGCAAVPNNDGTLSDAEIDALLAQVAREEIGAASPSLEKILFFREAVLEYITSNGLGPLNDRHAEFLRHELKRGSRAMVAFRIVDTDGVCRIRLEKAVPIGVKQHLHPASASDLTPPEFSFTVQRVGLHHLWTRI